LKYYNWILPKVNGGLHNTFEIKRWLQLAKKYILKIQFAKCLKKCFLIYSSLKSPPYHICINVWFFRYNSFCSVYISVRIFKEFLIFIIKCLWLYDYVYNSVYCLTISRCGKIKTKQVWLYTANQETKQVWLYTTNQETKQVWLYTTNHETKQVWP